MARIFVDCTNIHFNSQPTGIPRVVSRYVLHGIKWARKRGHQIYPVINRNNEFQIIRLWPFSSNPSTHPEDCPPANKRELRFLKLSTVMRAVNSRVRTWLYHSLLAVGLLLPVRGRYTIRKVDVLMRWFDLMLDIIPNHLEKRASSLLRILPCEGDILFSPGWWHDFNPDDYRQLRNKGVSIYLLVHDILPMFFPHYYNYPWREQFAKNIAASFDYANGFFCVSSYTAQCLRQYADSLDVPAPLIEVAYNGRDNISFSKGEIAEAAISSPRLQRLVTIVGEFLLMVGSIEPKKRHSYVIDQLTELWARGFELPLLIVGRPGWLCDSLIKKILLHPLRDKKLFWFDDLDDSDLAVAYQKARFLIFASEIEGFGLPLIEAMYNRCPVIAFDMPVTREIIGRYAVYYDQKRTQLADCLRQYTSEPGYRCLKESLAEYHWPTWEICVDRLFDRLVELSRNPATINLLQKETMAQFKAVDVGDEVEPQAKA